MMYTKVLEFANVFTNKQRNESHVRAYPCVIVDVYMFCLSNLARLNTNLRLNLPLHFLGILYAFR